MNNKRNAMLWALLGTMFSGYAMHDDQVFTPQEKAKVGYAWLSKDIICKKLELPKENCTCGKEIEYNLASIKFNPTHQTLIIKKSFRHKDREVIDCHFPESSKDLKNLFLPEKLIKNDDWDKFSPLYNPSSAYVGRINNQNIAFYVQGPDAHLASPIVYVGGNGYFGVNAKLISLIKEFNKKDKIFFDYWKSKRYLHSIDLIVAKENGKDFASVYVHGDEPFQFLTKICDIEDDKRVQISDKFLGSLGAIVLPNKNLVYVIGVRELPRINNNFSDIVIQCQN